MIEGFVKIRRGLVEHIDHGRINSTEYLVYLHLIIMADHKTGIIWKVSAPFIRRSGLQTFPISTLKRAIQHLEEKGYLKRIWINQVGGGLYNFHLIINNYELADGRRTDAHKVLSLKDLNRAVSDGWATDGLPAGDGRATGELNNKKEEERNKNKEVIPPSKSKKEKKLLFKNSAYCNKKNIMEKMDCDIHEAQYWYNQALWSSESKGTKYINWGMALLNWRQMAIDKGSVAHTAFRIPGYKKPNNSPTAHYVRPDTPEEIIQGKRALEIIKNLSKNIANSKKIQTLTKANK